MQNSTSKVSEHHAPSKSIRAPSGLRLQLDPIKFQKNKSCNLAKKTLYMGDKIDPLED